MLGKGERIRYWGITSPDPEIVQDIKEDWA